MRLITSSLVNQTLYISSQGAYRLEIISARYEVWFTRLNHFMNYVATKAREKFLAVYRISSKFRESFRNFAFISIKSATYIAQNIRITKTCAITSVKNANLFWFWYLLIIHSYIALFTFNN